MFNRFQTAQHLRAIFSDHNGLPDAIKPIEKAFHANYSTKFQVISRELFLGDERWKGKEGSDWHGKHLTAIPSPIYKALQVWLKQNDPGCKDIPYDADFQDSLYRHGKKFSILEKHRNDAHIIYKPDRGSDAWRAAVLMNIFSHQRCTSTGRYVTQAFAVVAPYAELAEGDEGRDLYRPHQTAWGRLCYNELDGTTHIIPFANIVSHFASQVQNVPGVTKECLLVQPST